eukprot:302735-Lingulodinium_polyedra.AAC.1
MRARPGRDWSNLVLPLLHGGNHLSHRGRTGGRPAPRIACIPGQCASEDYARQLGRLPWRLEDGAVAELAALVRT